MYLNRDKHTQSSTLVNPVQILGKMQTELMCTSLEKGYFNAGKPQTVTEYKMNRVLLRLVAIILT